MPTIHLSTDDRGYIVNKFKYVWRGLDSEAQVNKFEHFWGGRAGGYPYGLEEKAKPREWDDHVGGWRLEGYLNEQVRTVHMR